MHFVMHTLCHSQTSKIFIGITGQLAMPFQLPVAFDKPPQATTSGYANLLFLTAYNKIHSITETTALHGNRSPWWYTVNTVKQEKWHNVCMLHSHSISSLYNCIFSFKCLNKWNMKNMCQCYLLRYQQRKTERMRILNIWLIQSYGNMVWFRHSPIWLAM